MINLHRYLKWLPNYITDLCKSLIMYTHRGGMTHAWIELTHLYRITFPILVTVNLGVKESVKENVPVDSDLQIPNLLLLLTLRCEWCMM